MNISQAGGKYNNNNNNNDYNNDYNNRPIIGSEKNGLITGPVGRDRQLKLQVWTDTGPVFQGAVKKNLRDKTTLQ